MPKPSKSLARQKRREKRALAAEKRQILDQFQRDQAPFAPRKARAEPVRPLTAAQRAYDAAIHTADVVFGIGPAGTGKTWFAAMRAAEALDMKEIKKIIVTRPAVEAGESLGYLPGELEEKYEPYFRPVRDAFEEYFGLSYAEYLIKEGKIEARPLALLRGATIKDAWLIADEMQNATEGQFKMLLSRIGENAKFILNGDPKQSDLPTGKSGLITVQKKLEHIDGIQTVRFGRGDIVRSGICQAIVEAFEG